MSSTNAMTDLSSSGLNTSFMSRYNVAGALHSPNGITVNSRCPYLVRNAVLWMDIFISDPDLVISTGQIYFSGRTWLLPIDPTEYLLSR
jgi:hypothetical protein